MTHDITALFFLSTPQLLCLIHDRRFLISVARGNFTRNNILLLSGSTPVTAEFLKGDHDHPWILFKHFNVVSAKQFYKTYPHKWLDRHPTIINVFLSETCCSLSLSPASCYQATHKVAGIDFNSTSQFVMEQSSMKFCWGVEIWKDHVN